jgi:formamidopyrimidine-DNA glycosylase
MPELPEVETARRGIEPFLVGQRIDGVVVRERRLRWPVSRDVDTRLPGATVTSVGRRAKYLLIETTAGTAIVHLGMSGSVFVVDRGTPAGIHEHFDLELASGKALRYRDPRKFGSLHFCGDPGQHRLLRDLGPEPFDEAFGGGYLWSRSRGRRVAVKPFIMNAGIVVGVGNIYASEALYRAGIHPRRAAGRIARRRYDNLAEAIRSVLEEAIAAGGTTLRDFYGGDGEPGYFLQELSVYGREDEPCLHCGEPLAAIVLGQRATYYCKRCQT